MTIEGMGRCVIETTAACIHPNLYLSIPPLTPASDPSLPPAGACSRSHYFLGSEKVGTCRELSPFIFLNSTLLRDEGSECVSLFVCVSVCMCECVLYRESER